MPTINKLNIEILGFPHSRYNKIFLTFQTANVGTKVLLLSNSIKSKHAVINIQSRPGRPGSVVFNLKNNSVPGILFGAYASQYGTDLLRINVHRNSILIQYACY